MFKGKIIKEVLAYSLAEVSKILDIQEKDILEFFKIRNYIVQYDEFWHPTILGLESGCVTSSTVKDVIGITEEGFSRIQKAFTVSIQKEETAEIETTIPMERTKGTMCRFAKLREMKDMFTLAAMKAESPDGKEIWIEKANLIQKQIDNLTDEEAMEIVQ